MGPRSAWEEVLVVAEATAKPQITSTFQVRRQIVNFGGRRNHLGTLVKIRFCSLGSEAGVRRNSIC